MRPQSAAGLIVLALLGAACGSDTGGAVDSQGTAPLRAGVTTTSVGGAGSGSKLVATLTAAEEVPGPGKTGATGKVSLTLSPDGRVCASFTLSGLDVLTASHIHAGAAGVAGPVLVALPNPATGITGGCVTATPAQVSQVLANPSAYYVNVHTTAFPNGAIRGQLAPG